MNKKTKIILSATLVCVLAFGGWKYVGYKGYCETHFPSNTMINGINCSKMTKDEAKEALTSKWNEQEFQITENGKTLSVLKKMKFQYAINDDLQEIMDNGHKLPLYTTLFKKNADLTVSMTPSKWTKTFNTQMDELPIYEQENPVTTENAYIDMSNNKFTIVPEIYGNNIDQKKLKKHIANLIAKDVWTLDYKEEDFYTQPEIKKDSEKLLEKQEYCKKYLAHEITYTFGPDSYTITPAQLEKMMSADESGKVTVKKKKVKDFVRGLSNTYNTVGTNRAFNSTARGTVIIDGGTYGYIIDEEAETAQLTKDLKGLKDVSRDPAYAQAGWGWENNGFGTTYIEVDLANQTLWYYQNGECLLTSPFVSGNVALKHYTVTGAFSIVYMAQDVTLKGGDKKKGTDYATHVDYWMPFFGDYGLHDASWRGAFGGSIYLRNGSHGCVNMPPSKAAQLYYYASTGTPVIVF